MKCPFCSSENTRVIDSRPADDNNSIRRRRLCDECGKRFTTYEKVETIPLIVIKKDNNREQYDRSKIEAGVLRACHKRPISVNQINQLVDEVETEIFNREEKEIPSSLIGELVMDKLKDLYLNDLIDRDAYEKDYTALRDELRAATTANEKLPEPVNLKAVADALSAYSELSKEHKKEFWSRTIGKIVITNTDDFFVFPISP